MAGRNASSAVDVVLHRLAIDQMGQRLAYGGVGQQRVLSLDARALAIDRGRRIAAVELDVLDVAALRNMDVTFSANLEPLEDLIFDLHVPGIVVLAGLQHSASRRNGIAAALHLDGVKVRLIRHMIVRIEFASHDVSRIENDELIRTGADWLEVSRRIARFVALVSFEQM